MWRPDRLSWTTARHQETSGDLLAQLLITRWTQVVSSLLETVPQLRRIFHSSGLGYANRKRQNLHNGQDNARLPDLLSPELHTIGVEADEMKVYRHIRQGERDIQCRYPLYSDEGRCP